MYPSRWPYSLRSPFWPLLLFLLAGMAWGWQVELPTAYFIPVAAIFAAMKRWSSCACSLAFCLGFGSMNQGASLGRGGEWNGVGCFRCEFGELPVSTAWGWAGNAICSGGNEMRRMRIEGRGAAPHCVGTFTVWATCIPWRSTDSFDEVRFYGRRGIAGKLRVAGPLAWEEARDLKSSTGSDWMEGVRAALRLRLTSHFSERSSAFLLGITSGDKSLLSTEDRVAFSQIGLAHVLAVSGYHVGLVGFLPFLFARSKRQGLRWMALFGIPILAGYVWLCGQSESAMRAMFMGSLLLISACLRRRLPLAHAWCLAAWVMALLEPLTLLKLGTQLSFLAVIGIALGMEAARSITRHRLLQIIAVPTGAQSATAALTAPTFLQFPLAFLPVNVLAGPVVSVIGMLTMMWVLAPSGSWASTNIHALLEPMVHWFLDAVRWMASWDEICLVVKRGDELRWLLMSLGALSLFVAMIHRKRRTWWALAALCLGGFPWIPYPKERKADWVMERAKEPVIWINDVLVTAEDTSCMRESGCTLRWRIDDGAHHSIKGVSQGGAWSFDWNHQTGLGKLSIADESWHWERWGEKRTGHWPKKMGTEVPEIQWNCREFNSSEATASSLDQRSPPILEHQRWAGWR